MTSPKIETIVVYQNGTPTYVEPSLPDILDEVIVRTLKGVVSFDAIIGESSGNFSRLQWLMLLREIFGDVIKRSAERTPYQHFLLQLGQTVVVGEGGSKTWKLVKNFLVENGDLASGWTESLEYWLGQNEPVKRQGGVYTVEMEGATHQILGRLTDREERLDHIFGSCFGYGNLSRLFKFLVLLFICQKLKQSGDFFSPGIHLVLPERHPLDWYWNLKWPYSPKPIEWRPDDNLLDPKWLAADLVVELATKEGVSDKEMLPNDFKTAGETFDSVFKDYPHQLDVAIETPVRFGEVLETYFEFEGVPLRWVNQTDHRMSILTVPIKESGKYEDNYQLALRFLSKLSFQFDHPFSVLTTIGAGKRAFPWLNQPKQTGGVVYPTGYPLKEIKAKDTRKHNLALAFYREGKGADSVYYSFLNFYKILALQFNDDKKCVPWINQNLGRVRRHIALEKLNKLKKVETDIGNYLYVSGRCAIAHCGQEPIAKPDDLEDRQRLSNDLPIVQELARYVIETPCL